jgi:hypothetical protein
MPYMPCHLLLLHCTGLPTATSAKDGSGRLWGFADGGSCAFKDEQQQVRGPNIPALPPAAGSPMTAALKLAFTALRILMGEQHANM